MPSDQPSIVVDPARTAPPDDAHIDREAVRPGDMIAFRVPGRKRPVQARVSAVGKHGLTVRGPNKHPFRVRWSDVSGHAPAVHHDPVDGVIGLPEPGKSQWINKPEPLGEEAEHEVEHYSPWGQVQKAKTPVRGQPQRETMAEGYLRDLATEYATALGQAFEQQLAVADLWLQQRLIGLDKSLIIQKPAYLSPDDIEELVDLLRAYQVAQITGLPLQLPQPVKRGWLAWRMHSNGILPAKTVDLGKYAHDAFVLGRLQQILETATSLAEARRMAQQFPIARPTALAMIMAQESAGNYVTGWGDRLLGAARQTAIQANQDLLGSLLSAYFSGDLHAADFPPTGVSLPEQAWATGHQKVTSPHALALDLRRRFAAIGDQRDWDRLAHSEVRRLSNMGAIEAIAEAAQQAGRTGTKVYYLVAPGACDLCRKTYLDSKGQPRLFDLDELLQRVRETGGISKDKTVPNALLHPWCACRIMRATALGAITTNAAPLKITRNRKISKEQLERG